MITKPLQHIHLLFLFIYLFIHSFSVLCYRSLPSLSPSISCCLSVFGSKLRQCLCHIINNRQFRNRHLAYAHSIATTTCGFVKYILVFICPKGFFFDSLYVCDVRITLHLFFHYYYYHCYTLELLVPVVFHKIPFSSFRSLHSLLCGPSGIQPTNTHIFGHY